MMEYIEWNLKEEIKRADHLIYVSLKYTRTCDIIKNVIQRLINAFDYGIIDLLEHLKKKKKITIIPKSPLARRELVEQMLKKDLAKFMKLYDLLRKIDKSEFIRREEYRKGVTMIVKDKKPIEINIEVLKEYFEKTKEFVKFIENYEANL